MLSKLLTQAQQRISSSRYSSGNVRSRRLFRFAAETLILGLAVAPALAGRIGFDFAKVYRPLTLEQNFQGSLFNPWPIVWLIYPFAILPIRWGYFFWGLVQGLGFIYALRQFQGKPLWFALSLPCIWTFTQGQNEGFLAWGLALGMSTSPIVAGLGLMLLSLKPQLGLIVGLWILLRCRDWRSLIVPAFIYGLSFIVWGFWVDDWLLSSIGGVASSPQPEIINVGLFPYALILIPLFFILRDVRIWSLLQSLVLPYFAIYTFAPMMTMKWRSRWSMPVMVIGSWLVMATGIEQLPFSPAVQVMSFVPLAVLAVEGQAYLRETNVSSDGLIEELDDSAQIVRTNQ